MAGKIKFFIFIFSLLAISASLIHTTSVFAVNGNPGEQSPSVDCLRGWGVGDHIHTHCGPPGTSTHPPPIIRE